jgi:hypothetical protein
VVRAAGVRVFPGIADVQRMTDHPGAHLVAEQALQHVLVEGQRVLREDGITPASETLP